MVDYAEMYQRVKDKPCVLGGLSVDGLQRTNEAVVDRELAGLKDAKTLEELKDILLTATDNLQKLDIFDVVEIRLNAGQTGDDKGVPDTANVSVNLHETNVLKFHAGSYVNQSSEGSLEASLALKNYFGWAEQIEASAEVGNQQSSSYSCSYTQPRFLDGFGQARARVFQAITNHQRHSSLTDAFRGGDITYIKKLSGDGQQELKLQGGWQEISDRSRMASKLVQQQMGHRLRGSIKYTYSQTFEIEDTDPTSESLKPLVGMKSETEVGVAPISGAVGFAKQVLSGMLKLPTGESSDLTFAAKLGILAPLGGGSAGAWPTCISDRFFVGGVSTLRGFRTRGVGPMDVRRPPTAVGAQPSVAAEGAPKGLPPVQHDALGGDLMCSFLVEYNFPIPHPVLEAMGLKGHVFLNAGNTVLLNGDSFRAKVEEFSKTFRTTAGIGLFISTAMGRFEMNYCKVLSRQPDDQIKHGMQFGFLSDAM